MLASAHHNGKALRSIVILLGLGLIAGARQPPPAKSKDKPQKPQPIRILVPDIKNGSMAVVKRLKKLKFHVEVVPVQKLDPDRVELVDVIFLPTAWTGQTAHYNHFEAKKKAFHAFIRRGGGLLVCQPNPPASENSLCTPEILPYRITFKNWYDKTYPRRKNVDPSHFITDDLPGNDMPFPADPMVQIDYRYTILAKQISTGSPSLAVCQFGKGRVVVQTANENYGAEIPLTDEILRRMVVWAARREPAGNKKRPARR